MRMLPFGPLTLIQAKRKHVYALSSSGFYTNSRGKVANVGVRVRGCLEMVEDATASLRAALLLLFTFEPREE